MGKHDDGNASNAGDGGNEVGLSADERAALKEHLQEKKKAARRMSKAEKEAEAARDVVAKIADMPDGDRAIAERVHAVVTAAAPALAPKLWYGMPAYALDGKIVCFFQASSKFSVRYSTLGFNDPAKLDDGSMWATAFALTEVTPAIESRIAALVKTAVG
ncbi:iron chaperone [Streptomyces sp. NPDC059248]|uniref:iron chaperone n=1 Tax=Streptomyces sp. NPDC059248 TaxID=3346791 RepID=UPI003676D5B1